MTECERYQELISRMADEELTKSERTALSAHMEHCSQCNAMYAVFSNLSEIIGQDAEPLPEGLHENIMADIRRSAIKQRNINERRRFAIPRPFRNIVAAAACAAVVIFAAKGMLNEKMNETSAMSESEAAAAAVPVATAAATPQPTPAIPPRAVGAAQAQAPDASAVPAASPEVQSAGTDEDKYSGGSAVDNSGSHTAPSAPSNAPAAAPVSTPAPTQAPPVVETEKPHAVPTPAPTPVPTAVPDISVQAVPEDSSSPMAVEPEESEEPVGRFRSFFLKNAPAVVAEAPAEDEADSLGTVENGVAVQSMDGSEEAAAADSSKVIFAEIKTAAKRGELMRVLDGTAASPAPCESAKPEKPAESSKPEKPAQTALPSPSPSEAVAENALPEQDPDTVYEILFPQCKEEEEDFMSVCVFGEDVYWVVFSDDGSELVFRAACSVKELEDFMKPFILPEASPSPEVTPAAQETPRPVQ